MPIPRPRLNLVELVLIALGVAVVAFYVGRLRSEALLAPYMTRDAAELRPLELAYGPHRNTRYGEEWIIRDFFKDRRGGVFVDVGANHHQQESNTYFLETSLGWSGVAIEPQAKFAAGYAKYRPRTTFVPLFVSDQSNREAILHIPANNDLVASADASFVASEGGTDVQPVKTNTTTLDDVLDRSHLTAVDFVSIDVELHEPEVLKGFSIEKFHPALVCIEAHPTVRQQILDYFDRHDYVVVAKYLRADSENLWFMPIQK